MLNVTAALESIADGREELVQYVFDEFRYTPLQSDGRLPSHEAKREPRILPPQKPARQIDDRPVERLQELLWVGRQGVPRIDLVNVGDSPEPVVALRCRFGQEVVHNASFLLHRYDINANGDTKCNLSTRRGRWSCRLRVSTVGSSRLRISGPCYVVA